MIGHRITVTVRAPAGSKQSTIARIVKRELHRYGANVFIQDTDQDNRPIVPNALAGCAITIEVQQAPANQ